MQAVTITQISPPELETLIEKTISKCLSSNKPTPTQPATDQLLTITQVAEFISLSVATVYGLVSRSAIPCMKKGKRLYFSKDEISNWIKAGKKKTISELSAEADSFNENQLKKSLCSLDAGLLRRIEIKNEEKKKKGGKI